MTIAYRIKRNYGTDHIYLADKKLAEQTRKLTGKKTVRKITIYV